jgi:N-acetylglucosaminyldiphosphoundecaprenol N-acetyl-beta-D-mannosaminyltransferase
LSFPGRTKNILGVELQILYERELLETFRNAILLNNYCCFVGYFNAHHAVESWKDQTLRNYLNSLNILHSDGIGMYISSRFLYGKEGLTRKVNGTDFYPILLHKAERCHWKVFFLGDSHSTILKLQHVVEREYPGLNCVGYHHGFFNNQDVSPLRMIKDASPDILFVGLGLQKQMEWVQLNKHIISTSVRVCLLVGGGIGYLAKTRTRAPKVFQVLELEWFFRLCSNPRYYWHRYLIGIPYFVYLIVRQKLKL